MGFEWCINQDFWAKPRWFAGHQLDGECKPARGLKADLRVKVLIQRTIEGSMFEAYSHPESGDTQSGYRRRSGSCQADDQTSGSRHSSESFTDRKARSSVLGLVFDDPLCFFTCAPLLTGCVVVFNGLSYFRASSRISAISFYVLLSSGFPAQYSQVSTPSCADIISRLHIGRDELPVIVRTAPNLVKGVMLLRVFISVGVRIGENVVKLLEDIIPRAGRQHSVLYG